MPLDRIQNVHYLFTLERETFMSQIVHIADRMTTRSAAAGSVLVRLCSLISRSDKRLA